MTTYHLLMRCVVSHSCGIENGIELVQVVNVQHIKWDQTSQWSADEPFVLQTHIKLRQGVGWLSQSTSETCWLVYIHQDRWGRHNHDPRRWFLWASSGLPHSDTPAVPHCHPDNCLHADGWTSCRHTTFGWWSDFHNAFYTSRTAVREPRPAGVFGNTPNLSETTWGKVTLKQVLCKTSLGQFTQ